MGRSADDELEGTGRDRAPPARRRGPQRTRSGKAAAFVSRAAATDRRERFERRRREVAEIRRSRRRQQVLTDGLVTATVCGLFAIVGWFIAGTIGVVAGLGAAGMVGVVALAVRWAARRRGATAWDWTTQSHRLLGDPSDRVRSPDRREGQRGGERTDRSGPDRAWWRD